jgi:hypothetical protein
LEGAIRRGDVGEGERLMKALGIRYVLVRGDIDRPLAEDLGRFIVNEEVYEESLSQSSLVSEIATFGPLSLYESTASDAGLVSTWSAIRGAGATTFVGSRLGSDEIATVDSHVDVSGPVIGAEPAPEVRLTDASESRYVVRVDEAGGPFLLTLNQNFDDGWKASVRGDEPLPHVVANGFANGWVIRGEGSMDVVIEYGPERWAQIARAVSIAGLIGMGIVMLRYLWSKRASEPPQAAGATRSEPPSAAGATRPADHRESI